jgi:iron complex transport system substrate-binding protein
MPQQCPGGTFVIWTPGQWQCYGNRSAPFRHSWMHCDGTIVKRLLDEQRLAVDEPMRLPDPSLAERHLLAIYEELTRQSSPDVIIVRNLLENMLRETARAMRPEAGPAIPEVYLAARHLIESEYERRVTLKELAEKTNCSVGHFCEMFRRYFGVPAHEYLLRHRLHQAAYLLRDRNLSVKEAARRVGYPDMFGFSRLFKKHYGAPPSTFRKKQR